MGTPTPGARRSKQFAAYQLIRERIERGEYSPGQRLIIDQLAQEFGISQVPIREAIRRLKAESWIDYAANTGPTVAAFDAVRWAQLLETVAVLEGYATGLAAAHVSTSDLKQLVRCNQTIRASVRDIQLDAMSAANREFHAILLARCPNRMIVEQLSLLQARLDSLSRVIFARARGALMQLLGPRAALAAVADHNRLIGALRAHRGAATIEKLTREHVLVHMRAALEDLPRSQRAAHANVGGLVE